MGAIEFLTAAAARHLRLRPAVRATLGTLGLGLLVAMGPRPAAAQAAGCPTPVPVEVEQGSGLWDWAAEPDLVPVTRLVAERAARFGPLPGLPPESVVPGESPIRIYVLRDLGCLTALGHTDPGADWVAGVAHLQDRVIALRAERTGSSVAEVAAVLRHELAHLALDRASGGRAPRWLHEGYAQLQSGTWNWEDAWRLRFAFFRSEPGEIERIALRFPRDPAGARLAYQLSYTAVQTLWSISGERGFQAYVAALADGASTDQAFRRVFGLTEDQFIDRWNADVAGRYGFLFALSRAGVLSSLIAIPLIWAAIRRRRIRRERMDALREADLRDPPAEGFEAVMPKFRVDADRRSL